MRKKKKSLKCVSTKAYSGVWKRKARPMAYLTGPLLDHIRFMQTKYLWAISFYWFDSCYNRNLVRSLYSYTLSNQNKSQSQKVFFLVPQQTFTKSHWVWHLDSARMNFLFLFCEEMVKGLFPSCTLTLSPFLLTLVLWQLRHIALDFLYDKMHSFTILKYASIWLIRQPHPYSLHHFSHNEIHSRIHPSV
jgi:hypothetical protein